MRNPEKLPKTAQIGWQVYERTGIEPYRRRRDGVAIDLVSYRYVCADCGNISFASAAASIWRLRRLNRRCRLCKRPGIKVDDRKLPCRIDMLPAWAKPKEGWQKKSVSAKRYRRGAPHRCNESEALAVPDEPQVSYLD